MKYNPIPLIDRLQLQESFSGYTAPAPLPSIGNVNYRSLQMPEVGSPNVVHPSAPSDELQGMEAINNFLTSRSDDGGLLTSGGINRSLAEASSPRYDNFLPGDFDNEDAYARHQGFMTKAFNGFTKGLALTGTTFLQTTAGLVNGVIQARADGRVASFYDNEFSRSLDDFNKSLEDQFASYETNEFKNAKWYSPDYLLTGNFWWEGVVKNLGFAAGAALSGMAFAGVLRQIPIASRLFTSGKAVEAISKTEASIARAGGLSSMGKVKSLSDNFLQCFKSCRKSHCCWIVYYRRSWNRSLS